MVRVVRGDQRCGDRVGAVGVRRGRVACGRVRLGVVSSLGGCCDD